MRAVVDAMVDAVAVDDAGVWGWATSADLCAPYITLEEARRERAEEARDEARRDKWIDRLESAQFRALKRARAAAEEETDAARAAAMRARLGNGLETIFLVREEREVTRLAPLVEECLDDVRARAVQRGWAPLAPHWKRCLPKGVLASAALQPYLRRWAADDDDAAAAAVEAAPP